MFDTPNFTVLTWNEVGLRWDDELSGAHRCRQLQPAGSKCGIVWL